MDILLSIRSKTDGTVREVKSPIGEGLVVGRGAEEGILLDGPDLSREHFVLTTDGSNFYVSDLSSNGTWLNGTRLQRSVKKQLRVEDSIEVAGYALTFRLAVPAEKTGEAAIAPAAPQPVAEVPRMTPPPPEPPKPGGFLAPVSRFVGSFTFMEKVLLLVGVSGLLLLLTYAAS